MTITTGGLTATRWTLDPATSKAEFPVEQLGGEPERFGPSRRAPRSRGPAVTVLLDLVAPIALYYGLRAGGASIYFALLAGAAAPGLHAAVQVIRDRRIDALAAGVLGLLLASTGVALIDGSPRFLLAKDGLLTAAWGAWMYLSLLGKRPLTFLFSRPLLEGRRLPNPRTGRRTRTTRSWDELWQAMPRFRRVWRVTAVIWGAALLIDAALRIIMAYTLPIDVVPGLGGALWPATFIALQIVTNVYFTRSGMWQMLHGEPDRRAQPAFRI